MDHLERMENLGEMECLVLLAHQVHQEKRVKMVFQEQMVTQEIKATQDLVVCLEIQDHREDLVHWDLEDPLDLKDLEDHVVNRV